MRVKIKLEGKDILPRHNQHILNSYVHNCLGKNNPYHNHVSEYSISQLIGGVLIDDKMVFDGGYFIISSLDMDFLNLIINGIMSNSNLTERLKAETVEVIEERFFDGWNHFVTLTPFIIKRIVGDSKYRFLQISDKKFAKEIRTYLVDKISKIDSTLDLSDFNIEIKKHKNHKPVDVIITKKIKGKVVDVKNIGNLCHISIYTNKKVARLLYNRGIGQSTGCGFGTIYKTENHRLYW
jgi:CRISPR-associated endoribonuclease Cas6